MGTHTHTHTHQFHVTYTHAHVTPHTWVNVKTELVHIHATSGSQDFTSNTHTHTSHHTPGSMLGQNLSTSMRQLAARMTSFLKSVTSIFSKYSTSDLHDSLFSSARWSVRQRSTLPLQICVCVCVCVYQTQRDACASRF
jgi:hypothetical protein